jgi:hypothetical protein
MRQFTVGLLFLLGFPAAMAAQQGAGAKVEITIANEPWTLAFDVKDFSIKENGVQPDGRVYLLAENQKNMVTLSVYLERVQGAATASDCQATQKARLDEKVDYKAGCRHGDCRVHDPGIQRRAHTAAKPLRLFAEGRRLC